ncbi:hypothetical protein [Numidum massiliense]|uniref:hypothetical protein n=1 Tax=Numidum massiliense TaxID=1522315 RepID=UPI0006D54B0C|nr:hypothetical protein [Numidum massiliense]
MSKKRMVYMSIYALLLLIIVSWKIYYDYKANAFYRVVQDGEGVIEQTDALFYNPYSSFRKIKSILDKYDIYFSTKEWTAMVTGIYIEKKKGVSYRYNFFNNGEITISVENDNKENRTFFSANYSKDGFEERSDQRTMTEEMNKFYQKDTIEEYRKVLKLIYDHWNE